MQVVCFLLLVLCLGATIAVGLLGMTLWSVVLHVLKAESRSREMAMSVVEDWRRYRQDEHAAAQPSEEPEPDKPDNGFPDEMLPTVQVS